MADTDGGDVPQAAAAVPAEAGQGMTINDALKDVLRSSRVLDGLARGLHEAVKTLDKRQAILCVLAKNCSEATYVRLVEALCNEHHIALLRVEDREELGEWVGLCKIDKDGKPRKIVKCSCAVIKDLPDTQSWEVVQEYIKTKAATA
ncbi:small ribosomal subunit protein eS12-like [Halichondria panicea]|uniref:small ribosomal subunit protein eS12-like n=1 Tax=Halichondria panicea TaxID=6063 RepID=UPI00312B56F8